MKDADFDGDSPDNSVLLVWCFDEKLPPAIRGILDGIDDYILLAPPLLRWEFINGLLVAQRKGRFTADKLPLFVAQIVELPIVFDSYRDTIPFRYLLDLATIHKLTSYDAAYLETAIRFRRPLATLDQQLARAATQAGIKVL